MFFCKTSKMAKFKRQKDNKSNYYHFHSRIWLCHSFFFLSNLFCRWEKAWLRDACRLWSPSIIRKTWSFTSRTTHVCIWGSCLPSQGSLAGPFRNAVLTPQMEAYNTCMSKVRTSVEWLFGEIANSFKFLDFKKNLKIELSSVGKLYLVSAILRNALTCLYGNQASEYFDLDPPNLNDYFA